MSLRRVASVWIVTASLVAQSLLWPFSAYAESINSDVAEVAADNNGSNYPESVDFNASQDAEDAKMDESVTKEEDSADDFSDAEESQDVPSTALDETETADKLLTNSGQTTESSDVSNNDEMAAPVEPGVLDPSKLLTYSAHVASLG